MKTSLMSQAVLFAIVVLMIVTTGCSQVAVDNVTQDNSSSNTTLSQQSQRTEQKDIKIKPLTENITYPNYQLGGVLPYKNDHGDTIQLYNQPDTHNPTWDELCAFLYNDDTMEVARYGNKKSVIDKTSISADCAVTLHDHAALKGIHAGVVIVDRGPCPPEWESCENYNRLRMFTVFNIESFGKIWIESMGLTRIEPMRGGYNGQSAKVVFYESAIFFVETSDDGEKLVWTPMLKPKEGKNARDLRTIAGAEFEDFPDSWLNRSLADFSFLAKTREDTDGYRINHDFDYSDQMRLKQTIHVVWEQW